MGQQLEQTLINECESASGGMSFSIKILWKDISSMKKKWLEP
jgi:hypothetical protein